MNTTRAQDRKCSYVVLVQSACSTTELRELAQYLSTLSVAGCDVVILDPAPRLQFELNARILRWVGRHRAVAANVDLVRASSSFAACEKVIVAAEDVRYTPAAIHQLCELLESHEVVEPQDYLDPMPWWGGIEAGRILIHRGIEGEPDHGVTFGYRRTAIRGLRSFAPALASETTTRRLAAIGAEVYPASDVFVRREPGAFAEWWSARPRIAGDDFVLPVKTAFFFTLVPLLLLLVILGGPQLAGGYASVIAFVSIGLAARGRAGAATHFPMRACLFAPLWVLERSVSVYWALYRKVMGADVATSPVSVPDGAHGNKVASGE